MPVARRHRIATMLALLTAAAGLVGGALYAQRMEARFVHTLAGRNFPQKMQGTAFQAAAFRASDLLPIYGSSELNIADPYHGSELFKKYPTGFTIFPVGKAGTADLIILQHLAAVGADLKGKQVVISLSAPWFMQSAEAQETYAGNFSRQHAAELAFSLDLSMGLKRDAARRMLQYPATLQKDPLLRFALQQLAADSWSGRLRYWLVFPVGKLENLVCRLQDHWESVQYIRSQPTVSAAVEHKPAALDWTKLLAQARQEQQKNANNNPFGFDNQSWLTKLKNDVPKQKNTRTDAKFQAGLAGAHEWGDLDILLRGLKELGARPLVLSMPIQGTYYDYTGVSRKARQEYYDKLRQVTAPYGVPVLDFADHDEDKYFLIDSGAHLSREGWIYYDQAMDRFFHGDLP